MFGRAARTLLSPRYILPPVIAVIGVGSYRYTHPSSSRTMTTFKVTFCLYKVRLMRRQTEYAVPMECQDCVDSVSLILSSLGGISSFNISLKDQSVVVEGTIAPSRITQAIRGSGRAAILRGTGEAGDGLGSRSCIETGLTIGAAVCILDYHRQDSPHQDVRGLARMVQLSSSPPKMFVDVTMASYLPGEYDVVVREKGDLTRGVDSAGATEKVLGRITVDERGWGEWSGEVDGVYIWEVLGHAISVDKVAGVVARSAGVWENVKKVCACSGRTIWEEHQVMAKQTSVL